MIISKDAQAVVYRKKDEKIEFLLLKRFDKDKNENHYRLIKGGVEEGEMAKEASIREIQEEAGLTKLEVKNTINEYSYQVGGIRHDVKVFLVENTGTEEIKVDSENEGGFTIESAEWLSKDKSLEYLNFEQ